MLGVLGKGAMGLVYEAHDPHIKRPVAIKTIRIDQLSETLTAEYEVRFRDEARTAGRLHHPKIVQVFDAGIDPGTAYIVMELVRGGDLKGALSKGRRYSLDRALHIVIDLLDALDYAHASRVVHRDIKPANVMIDAQGHVKLADFGVARVNNSSDATQTRGSIVGTPKYMSPEQVRGERVDGRSDLFSVGVLLYEMLAGVRPFEASADFEVWQKICFDRHDPLSTHDPSLPRELDAVVDKALAKHRDGRFHSAGEFGAALRAILVQAENGQTTLAHRAPETPRSAARASRAAVAQELELLYWREIRESTDRDDFEIFLRKFPNGVYAHLARRRMRRLSPSGVDDSSNGGSSPPSSDGGSET